MIHSGMPYGWIKDTHKELNKFIREGNIAGMVMCNERLKVYFHDDNHMVPTKPIKSIYISHNLAARRQLKESALPLLYKYGFAVYSSWIWTDDKDSFESCNRCIEDLKESDLVIMFANQCGAVPGRGKYVELGLAMALDKRVFVIGGPDDYNCLFYRATGVIYCPTDVETEEIYRRLATLD